MRTGLYFLKYLNKQLICLPLLVFCLFNNSLFANDFNPKHNPSLLIETVVTDTLFNHLDWIIEEGETALNPILLSNKNLKDARVIDLSNGESLRSKGGNFYWFNIKINAPEQLENRLLAFYRQGNCWPWGMTFNEVAAFQIIDNQALSIGLSGLRTPAANRDIPTIITPSALSFEKSKKPLSEIWLRLRITEACNLKVQMQFLEETLFLSGKKLNTATTINLMIIGAILVLLVVSTFLFLKYREKIYVWFLVFLITQLANRFFIGFPNAIFETFFSSIPTSVSFFFTLSASLSNVAILQFWKIYVNIKEEFPRIHQTINIIIFAILFVTFMGLLIRFTSLNWDFWFKIRQGIMLLCSLNLLGISIFLIKKGKLLAKILSAGILAIFLVISIALVLINYNPDIYIFDLISFVGIVVVLIMTAALAYRFMLINDEKKAALAEKIEVEKANAAKDIKIQYEQAEAVRLKELDDFKSRLFTNLTHEFRTPLTVILGMTGQIKSNPEKHLKEATRLIESNGKNMLRLINQLLDLSKLEDKSFALEEENGDIVPYLKYLTESFHSFANNRNLSLQFFSNVEQLEMDFDPEQIKQVVSNLLSNAIKFTPEGGTISVKFLANKPSHISISVKDTGIGIAEKSLPHVFDRFYQGDSSDVQKGTGIGLAHSKELVELMGGSIAVESTLGQGTTFSVKLPIKNNSKQSFSQVSYQKQVLDTRLSLESKQPLISKREKQENLPSLLVIEDNPDVISYLQSCLEDYYQLEMAYNGKIGIEKALEQIPDLIISDVMMPQKNGFEVCDTLKNDERTSHIPIILLTAKADVASKIAGLRRGADAYLAKPFDKEELLVRLEKLLERQQRLIAHFSKQDTSVPSVEIPEEIIQVEDAFIQKVRQIVSDNYSDENFSLPNLCQKVRMSRSQLFRKMKALINVSPSQFIRDYRLTTAKHLLETSDLNVSEVAWQCGFKDVSHFSKSFLEKFDVLPSTTNK